MTTNKKLLNRNEAIRQILQACGSCKFGQGKGPGLVCTKKGPCHNKKVKRLVKTLEDGDDRQTRGKGV